MTISLYVDSWFMSYMKCSLTIFNSNKIMNLTSNAIICKRKSCITFGQVSHRSKVNTTIKEKIIWTTAKNGVVPDTTSNIQPI